MTNHAKNENNAWQTELRQAITSLDELCRRLTLPPSLAEDGRLAARDFPLLVPEAFLRRIQPGNLTDPLLRQILPIAEETRHVPGFSTDPLAENLSECSETVNCPAALHRSAGLRSAVVLQKYAGRALILASEQCGIHCRFCFRRHRFVQRNENLLPDRKISEILLQIPANSAPSELILSGGDPLFHDDGTLDQLLHCIEKFLRDKSHLSGTRPRIRIHSRLPVVMPHRWTAQLMTVLRRTMPVIVVLHVNHPRELDETRFAELSKPANVQLLSQTVLLAGVNDEADILCELFEKLIDFGIVPYYLHQLDRVAGAAHFEVAGEKGQTLMEELHRRLPGYAVPRYVREMPGFPYKITL